MHEVGTGVYNKETRCHHFRRLDLNGMFRRSHIICSHRQTSTNVAAYACVVLSKLTRRHVTWDETYNYSK